MDLNPADAKLAHAIRAELGDDVLRPVSERYLEEPRNRFCRRNWAVGPAA